MCRHTPTCPDADAANHDAAEIVAAHHEQRWSLLCNGVILFDDGGELAPDGHATGSHPGPAVHRAQCKATADENARRDLKPRECTEDGCGCRQHRWNGAPCMLRTDPPSTCICGHATSRHRFRYTDEG